MFCYETPLRRLRIACLVLVTAALLAAPPAAAAIHVVSDLGDDGGAGQIRAVIAAAVAGDTILVPAGTIVLARGQLVIDEDLTIIGASRFLTVLDGAGLSRVFHVTAAAHAAISGLTIRNGVPAAGTGLVGGGIRNDGSLDLVEVVVEDCRSEGGGGIWNFSGASMTIQASTVRRNSTYGVTASGAGITNWGTLSIAQSTISANHAAGNSSSAQGGGIQSGGELAIVNSTISGNRADANFGGGIHLIPSASSLSLTNVTITDNEAESYGGGLGVGGTSGVAYTLVNTIISGNRARGGAGHADCSGPITSAGYNLIGNTTGCVIGGDLTGTILGSDARLEPLADNGGPTETHALRPSSPAVDAGNDLAAPAIDQRGTARPTDGNRDRVPVSDIGAYELVRR